MPSDKKRFSYSCLPDAQADELRGIAATLEPLLMQLHSAALEAGRALRRAKDMLRHGDFGPFCRDVMNKDPRASISSLLQI